MKKYELREQGFSVEERFPKKRAINIVWLIFTVLMIAGTYIVLTAAIGYSPPGEGASSPIDVGVNILKLPIYFIELIVSVFIYFALKLAVTLIFCADKNHSTQLKTINEKTLPIFPICYCREAFKIWQTAVMYIAPIIIVYAYMFLLCVFPPIDVISGSAFPFDEVEAGYMAMLFFMSFFMAFDLTLVAYTLYFKIKEKIDYISIDYHIYGVTLFKKTYVKFSKKPGRYLKTNSKYMDEGKFRF